MAFEGDLSHLALGDVLQTLAMSRQCGIFVIRGTSDERRLAFGQRGAGLLTVRQALRDRVGEYLLGKGRVQPDAYEQAQKVVRRKKDAAIEDVLFERGAVTEKDIAEARRYVAAEDVYELFLWTQGTFEFLAAESGAEVAPYGGIWFDLASIAMEAARRMDEVGRLRASCPETEIYVPAADSGAPDPSKFGNDAPRVLALADGSRTVDGVLAASHLGRFDTWKLLDTLREAGYVRPAEPPEMTAAADTLLRIREYGRAAPILRRLLEVNPSDLDARRNLVQALISAGEKRAAAVESVELGRRAYADSEGSLAVECFRQAVRLDKDNAAAQDGLARSLLDTGDVAGGAEAARAAASLHIDAKAFDAAVAIATRAVECCPEDAGVRIAGANAYLAAAEPAQALLLLDDAASLLETTGDDQRRLLEVYRRILQLDPSRRDCARRVEEVESKERYRRRMLAQRGAIAVGVLIVALLSIPALRGPSVIDRIDKARLAIAEGRMEEATALIAELGEETLTEDEQIELNGVRTRLDEQQKGESVKDAEKRLSAAVKRLCEDAVEAQSRGWSESLALFGRALDALDPRPNSDAATLGAGAPASLSKLRQDIADDVATAFTTLQNEAAAGAANVASAREKFTPEVFQKEDPEVLEHLVAKAGEIAKFRDSQDWTETAKGVEALRSRVRLKDDPGKRILDAIQSMTKAEEGFAAVERSGAEALAVLRKKRLLDRSPETHGKGHALLGEGKLTEARDVFASFLEQCEEMRRAEPRELYDHYVRTYLDGFNLEATPRERLRQIDSILDAERQAEESLARGAVEDAFRLRRDLVLKNRAVDFRNRFKLPIRIESSPSGASVSVLDGTGGGRVLGTTPVAAFEYPVEDQDVKLEIRLDGFESRTVVRHGALEDEQGVVSVELPKRADWSAADLGKVHAAAVQDDDRIVVAGRDGKVRLLSARDGSVVAGPFETGSLGGAQGSAAVTGTSVFVATVEGKGFVLDSATLARVRHLAFDGEVRRSLLSTPRGVLVATEAGTVTLYDASGAVSWTRPLGKTAGDPVVAGHRAVLVTADGHVVALDLASGRETVRIRLPEDARWSGPVALGDRVWAAGDAGLVVCADLATQRIAWRRSVDAPVRARPAIADGRLLVVTSQGALHSLDPGSGGPISRDLLGAPVSHPPLALDTGWVVTTDKGMVLRYDSTGAPVWRFDARDELSAPAAYVCGRIVVVTRKGTLFALRP